MMIKLSVMVVTVCSFRFLFDGVVITIGSNTFSLGHIDALSYGSIMTPILGVHGYIHTKLNAGKKQDEPERD